MPTDARWIIEESPGDARVARLAEELAVGPVLARLLAQRVQPFSTEAARSFLAPSLLGLTPPRRLPGMDAAVRRLREAVGARQNVVVYADYDADGVTACALLLRVLRALGLPAGYYLPSRMEEGYGISDDFVRRALEAKLDLVVTVDCGASEHARVRTLTEGGVDVIVTDHHEPGERPPPAAAAVVNPKLPGGDYPFRELAGVGVAFKLAWALCEAVAGSAKVGPRLREVLLAQLPLVALGTIADVAPLVAENRIAVAHGLRRMHQAAPGIRALLEVCNLTDKELTVRHVAFNLSPRLNAAGRMGSADLAVNLLLEDDAARARELAEEINQRNNARQALCQTIQEEAEAMVLAAADPAAPAVAVAKDDWHEGVIGIVAGRLAERFEKPAAVATFAGGEGGARRGRGSARGAGGVNLYDAMTRTAARLLTFGGHEQAAGFSLRADAWEAWSREFIAECGRQRREQPGDAALRVDMEMPFARLSPELAAELDVLRPYGQGNPEPLFIAKGVRVTGTPRLMGRQQKHFAFNATQDGVGYRAVVFGRPEYLREIDAGRLCWDIVYTPFINDFNGARRLELRIEDMRPAADPRLSSRHRAARRPAPP